MHFGSGHAASSAGASSHAASLFGEPNLVVRDTWDVPEAHVSQAPSKGAPPEVHKVKTLRSTNTNGRPSVRRSVPRMSMTFEESIAVTSTGRKQKTPTTDRNRFRFLHYCERLLSNKHFTTLMAVLTVYVLVGDDIRLMSFEADADIVFDVITAVCLVLFSLELVLAVLVKEDYFNGFWFFADLFASASLILDLTVVSEAILGTGEISIDSSGGKAAGGFEESQYARASRSSRVGSRIARILRVLRLARVNTFMKRMFQVAARFANRLIDRKPLLGPGDEPVEIEGLLSHHHESRVGKKLGEKTPQRVIVIVLALLITLPQLEPGDSSTMLPTAAQYGADLVLQAWLDLELAAEMRNHSWTGDLAADALAEEAVAQWRWTWEVKTLTYIYYHRYDETASWLYKLCWIGYVRKGNSQAGTLDVITEGRLRNLGAVFSPTGASPGPPLSAHLGAQVGAEAAHMAGKVPKDILQQLALPWTTDCTESNVWLGGTSMLPGVPCPRKRLRSSETTWYMPIVHNRKLFDPYMEGQFVFVFDVREKSKWEAAFGVLQTVFVVIVLAIAALLFSRDVDRLVLLPIERMIGKVDIIRRDPLKAARLGESGEPISPSATMDRHKLKLKAASSMMETQILENTIIKLGSLLALGFGDAGVNIIAENMLDSNAKVTVKIPGTKVEAIFGFCDIRNFNVITEVLKERTMVFVNQVADIVHRIVDQHLGAANKNLGHSFLLVWQFNRIDHPQREKLADLSVVAFIQVVSALSRDLRLSEISAHPLLTSRMPGFRVSVGFGLHLGWAIAGAIGSEYKIDASYVSPHVNLAAQLEDAAWSYGVTILMSEPLVRLCNPEFRRCFRPIDHVQLAGSSKAMHIFTVDLDTSFLRYVDRTSRRKLASRTEVLAAREKRRKALLNDSYRVHEVLVTDKYIWAMRQHLSLAFFQQFECGFLNYVAGEWGVAAQVLAKTRVMLLARGGSDDGPSRCLVEYMGSYGNEAPADWPGWHELRPN